MGFCQGFSAFLGFPGGGLRIPRILREGRAARVASLLIGADHGPPGRLAWGWLRAGFAAGLAGLACKRAGLEGLGVFKIVVILSILGKNPR